MRLPSPTTKSCAALFFAVAGLCLPWEPRTWLSGIVIVSMVLSPLLFLELRRISRRILAAVGYFTASDFVILVVNGILIQSGTTALSAGPIQLSLGGLQFGTAIASRYTLLALPPLFFFLSTSRKDVLSFLESLHVSQPLLLIVTLSYYFVQEIPSRIARIFTAQEARGIPIRSSRLRRGRALVAVLSPLVLAYIVESIDRSTALDLRGVGGPRSTQKSRSVSMLPLSAIFFLTLTLLLLIVTAVKWLLL